MDEAVSRNLGHHECYHCGEPVRLEEDARPITSDEAGWLFKEYEGMLVANAHCPDCLAKYLAWCKPAPGSRVTTTSAYDTHYDLSHRSTFNSEAGEADLPKYHIVRHITLERVPVGKKAPETQVRKTW